MQYLAEHPERFIEGNLRNSWLEYLTSMNSLGTWCDAIIVQAVSDAFNILINIVESIETFAPYTIIRPANISNISVSINIGHIDEIKIK